MAILLDDNLGRIRADVSQVEQVLLNLVVNAREAMQSGGKLVIETRDENGPEEGPVAGQRSVFLSVSDNGIGMTEEMKARIFEPFFSTKEHGIGLGFATTYGIVASWDGTISVTSDPGHGTCFEIRFPRVEPPSAEEVKDHELRTTQGVDALSLVTVLLVDDEPSVRTFMPRVLERAGCEVVEAGTGEEALRLLESDPTKFDLILTDVVMPIMGGYELAAEAARVRPGLPTVLMSGYLDSSDAQASVVGDDLPFIGKPFRSRDLLRVLGEAMNPN